MYGKNKDDPLIASVSGHRSSAIRRYRHISDSLRGFASEAIQGEIVEKLPESKKKPAEAISKPPSDVNDSKVGSDHNHNDKDFESEAISIRTPMKRKIEQKSGVNTVQADVSQVKNLFDMISTMSTMKKV